MIREDKDNQVQKMTDTELQEQLNWMQYQQALKLMSIAESIPNFARDNDESNWRVLTNLSAGSYTESELSEMRDACNSLYYTDPSARGIIDTMVNFIIGKECTIAPKDEDETVRDYWKHFCEINNMDMRIKEWVIRTLKTGESFVRMYPHNPSVSYVHDIPLRYQVPLIRFVNPNDITDTEGTFTHGIHTDSNDIETVVEYIHRVARPDGSYSREVIPADQIIHTKILVDSDVLRGLSFLVGIAKYIKKYSEWLDDRCVLNKIRTMFNLIMKVTGSPSAFAQKFESAEYTTSSSSNTVAKKMPKRGSVLVSTPGIEYEYQNLNIRAQDTVDDGRAIELMLSKGTGLTEYITRGDASNANYASSMVSESPMVRVFQAWQDFFQTPFRHLYRKVIRYGLEHGQIPSRTKRTIVVINDANGTEEVKEEMGDINRDCTVNFETLIHRDVKDEAESFAIHKQNGWDSDQGIMIKLGNDPEAVRKQLRREETLLLARMERMRKVQAILDQNENSEARKNKQPDPGDGNPPSNGNPNGED
ncbi:MAG: phage portal protein [Dehalococcoidia bacterium]|nr:phage portal protein [Dehalococcoidia bacterium]